MFDAAGKESGTEDAFFFSEVDLAESGLADKIFV
jgi:hypothetical protein